MFRRSIFLGLSLLLLWAPRSWAEQYAGPPTEDGRLPGPPPNEEQPTTGQPLDKLCSGAKGPEAAACRRIGSLYSEKEINVEALRLAQERAQRQSWLYGGPAGHEVHLGLRLYNSLGFETRGECGDECSKAASPWRSAYVADFGARLVWHPLALLDMHWITLYGQGGARAGFGSGHDTQWSPAWAAGLTFGIGRFMLNVGFDAVHTSWATASATGGETVVEGKWTMSKYGHLGAGLTLGSVQIFAEVHAGSREGYAPDGTQWTVFSAPVVLGTRGLVW